MMPSHGADKENKRDSESSPQIPKVDDFPPDDQINKGLSHLCFQQTDKQCPHRRQMNPQPEEARKPTRSHLSSQQTIYTPATAKLTVGPASGRRRSCRATSQGMSWHWGTRQSARDSLPTPTRLLIGFMTWYVTCTCTEPQFDGSTETPPR